MQYKIIYLIFIIFIIIIIIIIIIKWHLNYYNKLIAIYYIINFNKIRNNNSDI